MGRKYYHPIFGTYYERSGFEGMPAAIAGVSSAGIISVIAKPATKLAMALPVGIGMAAVGGLLYPKKILSWYDPPPYNPPANYPPETPSLIVPSYIGDIAIALNWLVYNGEGDKLLDYTGKYNGVLEPPSGRPQWIYGPWGWSVYLNGLDQHVSMPNKLNFPSGSYWSWEGWLLPEQPKADVEHYSLFSNGGEPPVIFVNNALSRLRYYPTDYSGTTLYWDFPITPNTWCQMGIDCSPDEIRFIYNGVVVGSRLITNGQNEMSFGQFGLHWNTHRFQGLVGPQRVYSRILSDSEWASHFDLARSIFEL